MPRPKVKPQDRQRTTKACTTCKASKVRCDSQLPCYTCSRRGRASSCAYEGKISRLAGNGHRRHGHTRSLDDGLKAATPQQARRSSLSFSPRGEEDASALPSTLETQSPQSRMLLSSKGQKVYIGETASLSYLQFLRQVLKLRVGPCSFTENSFSNYMLEYDLSTSGEEGPMELSIGEKQDLVQCYIDASSGILDLYTNAEITTMLERPQSDLSNDELAALCLILAIGAQCRGSSAVDLRHSALYFSIGQKRAFEGMLCDPSPDMVRIFLLMAFYMLGACRRNAAFMYLGVASKASWALGLHRPEHYASLSSEERHVRLSSWQSVRVLDSIVNSILGRSGGLSDKRHTGIVVRDDTAAVEKSESTRTKGLRAMFDMCPFMDELEHNGSNIDVQSAEGFLQRLRHWSEALPSEFRRFSPGTESKPASTSRDLFIGSTHVAIFYYFAVILATRPFFTLYLVMQLRDAAANSSPSLSTGLKDHAGHSSNLAHVCLNAAISIANLCHNAMSLDLMLNNMCIIKAWVFAAGLLLGFWTFAHRETANSPAEESFHQAREVLNRLSDLSPQARHYFEILTSFSDAIDLYRQHSARERQKVTEKYMGQIFTIDLTEPVTSRSSAYASPSTSGQTALGQDTAVPSSDTEKWPQEDLMAAAVLDGMPDLQSFEFDWDEITANWQPFAPFFDGTQ